MIVKNIDGKKVNATSFQVELINGYAENEHGRPTLLLKGMHSYVKVDRSGDFSVITNEEILERVPCNENNVSYILERKEKYKNQNTEIEKQMELELGEVEPEFHLGLKNKWLVEHGYQFYEKDEYHFRYSENCRHEMENNELELEP